MKLRMALAASAALFGVSGSSQAQNLTSRLSTINYNSVYGGGGDVFTPSDTVTDNTLLATDSEALAFADSRAGFILNNPDRPWGASVEFTAAHTYTVTGALDSFTRIQASGSTHVAAASSGEGLASISSVNPGNELLFHFTLDSAKQASLSGHVSLNPDGQNLKGQVVLQRFDGITWATVFNSLFLSGQEGTFDNDYNLLAGDYRLIGYSAGDAFHQVRPFQDNGFSYDFQVVPEPGTFAALGLGLAALRRRRTK